VWTIEAPENAGEYTDEHEWTLFWEPDLILWRVWDPEWADRRGPERFSMAIDKTRFPNVVELERLNEALAESSPAAFVIGSQAWSAEQVSNGLVYWAEHSAGRPDITFHWNPEGPASPLLESARETMERIDAGEEEPTVLMPRGEGSDIEIRASSNVMDFFMSDPEAAAEIMEQINQHLSDYEKKGNPNDHDDD
jgi:hypothetical protein